MKNVIRGINLGDFVKENELFLNNQRTINAISEVSYHLSSTSCMFRRFTEVTNKETYERSRTLLAPTLMKWTSSPLNDEIK